VSVRFVDNWPMFNVRLLLGVMWRRISRRRSRSFPGRLYYCSLSENVRVSASTLRNDMMFYAHDAHIPMLRWLNLKVPQCNATDATLTTERVENATSTSRDSANLSTKISLLHRHGISSIVYFTVFRTWLENISAQSWTSGFDSRIPGLDSKFSSMPCQSVPDIT
jgi:hypothetical protein